MKISPPRGASAVRRHPPTQPTQRMRRGCHGASRGYQDNESSECFLHQMDMQGPATSTPARCFLATSQINVDGPDCRRNVTL